MSWLRGPQRSTEVGHRQRERGKLAKRLHCVTGKPKQAGIGFRKYGNFSRLWSMEADAWPWGDQGRETVAQS